MKAEAKIEDELGRWLKVQLCGTPDAGLREWGLKSRRLFIFLRMIPRDQHLRDEELFYTTQVKEVDPELEWKSNCLPEPSGPHQSLGELGGVAELAEEMGFGSPARGRRAGRAQETEGTALPPAAPRNFPVDGRELSYSPQRAGEGEKEKGREAKKKKKKKKAKDKVRVLEMLKQSRWSWRGSSLDPEFKRPKIKLRRGKGDSDSSSSSSHSGGPESKVLDSDEELLFPEESQAKYVARRCPGLLAKMGLQRRRKTLCDGMGLSLASREPGPAMVQYFRQTLSRLNPSRPLAREALSLCAVMDQLFEGEVVRALDVSMQRLKYLEAIMRGRRPEVASRMELIPSTASPQTRSSGRLQRSRSRTSVCRPPQGGAPGQGAAGQQAEFIKTKEIKPPPGKEKGAIAPTQVTLPKGGAGGAKAGSRRARRRAPRAPHSRRW